MHESFGLVRRIARAIDKSCSWPGVNGGKESRGWLSFSEIEMVPEDASSLRARFSRTVTIAALLLDRRRLAHLHRIRKGPC